MVLYSKRTYVYQFSEDTGPIKFRSLVFPNLDISTFQFPIITKFQKVHINLGPKLWTCSTFWDFYLDGSPYLNARINQLQYKYSLYHSSIWKASIGHFMTQTQLHRECVYKCTIQLLPPLNYVRNLRNLPCGYETTKVLEAVMRYLQCWKLV